MNKEALVRPWEDFYADVFSRNYSFEDVAIPPKPEGFDRLIVVARGMMSQLVYNRCSQHFSCGKYTDLSLDDAVPTNERDPKNGSYAIWVRDVVEADEQYKSKSADRITREQYATETLLERLLHELIYFRETGEHLDHKSVTLCAGSRDFDGEVPIVGRFGGRLGVSRCRPGRTEPVLRARKVAA